MTQVKYSGIIVYSVTVWSATFCVSLENFLFFQVYGNFWISRVRLIKFKSLQRFEIKYLFRQHDFPSPCPPWSVKGWHSSKTRKSSVRGLGCISWMSSSGTDETLHYENWSNNEKNELCEDGIHVLFTLRL